MKKMSIIGIVVMFSLLCAGALYAADYGTEPAMQNDMSKTNMTDTQATMTDRASKIIGMTVQDPQGEKLGSINDITFDNHTGRVAFAVLGSGGIMGLGEKYYAVPWKALSMNTAGDALILNVDKEKLKNAPSFDKSNWPDFADRAWGMQIYRFYGQQPYWQEQPAQ